MTGALRARTSSAAATKAIAAALAELARPGDLVLLAGDLGAGKTAFAQGFARGLGVTEQVTSPTFTLARNYAGRLRFNHLDVYRLDHLQEAVDLGLPELVDDGAVTLIEWGDVVTATLPADFLEVRLAFVDGGGDDERALEVHVVGRAWAGRTAQVEQLLAPYRPADAGPGSA